MKHTIDVSYNKRIVIDEFGASQDLQIMVRQPNGNWTIAGAVLLSNDDAVYLGTALINRTPDASRVLKAKYFCPEDR